jgi:hypothetical protein
MAYSKFTDLGVVAEKFNLKLKNGQLFTNCEAIETSEWLKNTVEMAKKYGYLNEKERSERLVNPILFELGNNNKNEITIYSGRDLNVDSARGLNGECDFLLAFQTVHEILEAPIFSVVEAKKQDIEYGMAQCTAQMLGAQLFNQTKNNSIHKIYGAVTTGGQWKFLMLKNNDLLIDSQDFYLSDLPKLLGYMQCIFNEYKLENPSK